MTAERWPDRRRPFGRARWRRPAIGCGALLRHGDGYGEVKRMYVRPAAQGQGVAGRILDAIEAGRTRRG
jgi:putative acetyltransferase